MGAFIYIYKVKLVSLSLSNGAHTTSLEYPPYPMAEANFFPDSVPAKFTLNAQNVRLDSEEGLPPFIGRVVESKC